MSSVDQKLHNKILTIILFNYFDQLHDSSKTLKSRPSYLTEAWLPEEAELFDDNGVGLSNDHCLGFDEGSGSVCV